MNNLAYQYHISGAVKSAVAYVLDNATSGSNGGSSGGVLNESTTAASSVPKVLYSETLYYEDCDSEGCTPQYNGNISRMVHHLAHGSPNYSESRDVAYAYDMLNRLTKVEDDVEDYFDEIFNYDAQGRIVQQRRGQNLLAMRYGGEYSYYTGSNQLEKVMGSMSIDDSGNKRDMSAGNNFLFDRDGNMIEDKSKEMTVKYNHRGLPTEFKRERSSDENGTDSVRLVLNYDGAGSRITKKRERKVSGGEWTTELATHYTGIGSEIREDAVNNDTKVVVNLPQGLGRYDIASANESSANTVPSFEWYLKNHLGSTMLVYGTQSSTDPTIANHGSLKAAYDYRAFGEQVDLTMPTDKVTETFTGKELDDETELSYFGARYLDQMLGMWVSVDAKRQFNSPYLYAGNGTNPVNGVDEDGNLFDLDDVGQEQLDMAYCTDHPILQENLAVLEVSPEVFKSSSVLEGMKTPQFNPHNNTFYYNPSSKMSLFDQFVHEMGVHGYQKAIGSLPQRPMPISLEVDAFRLQFDVMRRQGRTTENSIAKTEAAVSSDRQFGSYLTHLPIYNNPKKYTNDYIK